MRRIEPELDDRLDNLTAEQRLWIIGSGCEKRTRDEYLKILNDLSVDIMMENLPDYSWFKHLPFNHKRRLGYLLHLSDVALNGVAPFLHHTARLIVENDMPEQFHHDDFIPFSRFDGKTFCIYPSIARFGLDNGPYPHEGFGIIPRVKEWHEPMPRY